MADETIIDDQVQARRNKAGLFTILSGVGFFSCLISPRILLVMPVFATLVCGVVGVFQNERPRWLPALFAVLAVVVILLMDMPDITVPNSLKYRNAEWQYGSDQTYGSWARIYSDTDLDLASPYEGDNPAYLQVSASDENVLLVVTKGQIIAPYRDCTVEMNNITFSCKTPDGFDNDHLLITTGAFGGNQTPATLVRQSADITVKVQFFDNGFRTLHFHTAGLRQ